MNLSTLFSLGGSEAPLHKRDEESSSIFVGQPIVQAHSLEVGSLLLNMFVHTTLFASGKPEELTSLHHCRDEQKSPLHRIPLVLRSL